MANEHRHGEPSVMRFLVTAGNTQVQIDRVRAITNIFTGRTGARIALAAHDAGHSVSLLTSHPELLPDFGPVPADDRWSVTRYRTFEDLEEQLEQQVRQGHFDVAIHVAAVSDYRSAGVYRWKQGEAAPTLIDRNIGKIKSDDPELWLRLVRTPKLIDKMRIDWGFAGTLVKFKLEVGLDDPDLLAVAERSRVASTADLMVANTLEGAEAWAYLGPIASNYQRVSRNDLPVKLLEAIAGVRRNG